MASSKTRNNIVMTIKKAYIFNVQLFCEYGHLCSVRRFATKCHKCVINTYDKKYVISFCTLKF